MSQARFLVGDVFERMAEIPDGSVDLVMTSPPFLALRSYLPADHPQKDREIGSEPTPAVFLDTLLALTAEWRRVLAPHGSICVELGDTYSGTGGNGSRTNHLYDTSNRYSDEWNIGNTAGKPIEGVPMTGGNGWPLDKSLCGIPHLYASSLAYGRNLLTGEPSPAGQWRVRNVVAWCRPNPPVGALGDKFRPATSYLTMACVGKSRYFDLDAVRTPHADQEDATRSRVGRRNEVRHAVGLWSLSLGGVSNPAGAPPLDWWEIPTAPYVGSHYATFPEALCVRPIKAMCPERVCRTCGKPSERITSEPEYVSAGRVVEPHVWPSGTADAGAHSHKRDGATTRTSETLGWSDCGHGTWRRGVCLDPFAGSGTTLAVAVGHGRDAIGIDLDPRNADLARERCGLFLEVDEPSPYLSERPTVDVPPSREIA